MKKKSKPGGKKHAASRARARRKSSHRGAARSASNNLQVVFSEPQIQKRVRQLAEQLNQDYKGRTLYVVGILENCFMFMADLVRHLKIPTICYFVRAQISDGTSGQVSVREIRYIPHVDAAGKDVLLVDGILQSGVTLDHLYRYMLGQKAGSVCTASLIEKTDERKVDVPTDYIGFKTTAKFLVGYGLGYQDRYRNLSYVASMT